MTPLVIIPITTTPAAAVSQARLLLPSFTSPPTGEQASIYWYFYGHDATNNPADFVPGFALPTGIVDFVLLCYAKKGDTDLDGDVDEDDVLNAIAGQALGNSTDPQNPVTAAAGDENNDGVVSGPEVTDIHGQANP